MKQVAMLLLIFNVIVIFIVTGQASAYPEQHLSEMGIDFSLSPLLDSDNNYVPLKQVAKYYGMTMKFDIKNKKVNLSWNKTNVLFMLESRVAEVNGKRQTMDHPVVNVNGIILVPLTFMENLIKVDFKWIRPDSVFTQNGQLFNYPTVSIRCEDSYKSSEKIYIYLLIKNDHPESLKISLPSDQFYDISLFYQGKEIWRWGTDKVFIYSITNFTLNSGGQESYYIDLPSELLRTPGQYQIQASFGSMGAAKSDILTFTIQAT